MTFLLDVNVLIALIDRKHGVHEAAHRWFQAEGYRSWATCPLTENGVFRIVGNPRYPNFPGSPTAVADSVRSLLRLPGHVFWPDDLSLFNRHDIDIDRIATPMQVTDTYLLVLAKAHGGRFATFDRRLSIDAIKDGRRYLVQVPIA